MKSEEEYLNNLRIFSKFYLPAFQQVKDGQIPVADINLIFYPALSGLTSLHEQFFARLTTENIPHTLLSTMSYFKMYGQICSNQELCLETAKKLSKDNKFAALTAKCKKESKYILYFSLYYLLHFLIILFLFFFSNFLVLKLSSSNFWSFQASVCNNIVIKYLKLSK